MFLHVHKRTLIVVMCHLSIVACYMHGDMQCIAVHLLCHVHGYSMCICVLCVSLQYVLCSCDESKQGHECDACQLVMGVVVLCMV